MAIKLGKFEVKNHVTTTEEATDNEKHVYELAEKLSNEDKQKGDKPRIIKIKGDVPISELILGQEVEIQIVQFQKKLGGN